MATLAGSGGPDADDGYARRTPVRARCLGDYARPSARKPPASQPPRSCVPDTIDAPQRKRTSPISPPAIPAATFTMLAQARTDKPRPKIVKQVTLRAIRIPISHEILYIHCTRCESYRSDVIEEPGERRRLSQASVRPRGQLGRLRGTYLVVLRRFVAMTSRRSHTMLRCSELEQAGR